MIKKGGEVFLLHAQCPLFVACHIHDSKESAFFPRPLFLINYLLALGRYGKRPGNVQTKKKIVLKTENKSGLQFTRAKTETDGNVTKYSRSTAY